MSRHNPTTPTPSQPNPGPQQPQREVPPHMDPGTAPEEEIPQDSEILADDQYTLPELKPFGLDSYENEDNLEARPCILDLPTLYSPYRFKDNNYLASRRSESLKHASGYFRRKINPNFDLVFSKKLARDVYFNMTNSLDDLLLKPIKLHLRDENNQTHVLYTVDRRAYRDLSTEFFRADQELRILLQIDGLRAPSMPKWGKDGDVTTFHKENEYEILATAFRTEAEQFLAKYHKVYDFNKCQPKRKEVRDVTEGGGVANLFNKSTTNEDDSVQTARPAEETSQHQPVQTPASQTAKTPVPSRHGRPSALFGYSTQGISQLEQQFSKHTKNEVHTGTLQGVLGNIGERFQKSEPKAPANVNPDNSFWGASMSTPKAPKVTAPKTDAKVNAVSASKEPHFDNKLKPEMVPKWDGNTDTLFRWLQKVNNIALMSKTVFEQLGQVVPRRLEGNAEIWYWSLPESYRETIEEDWDALKTAISDFYMNRKWIDQQKGKAIRAYYREPGHSRETPSDYYIRKTSLLNIVWNLQDSELIMEVMQGAPATWNTVLTTQLYATAVQFQAAIKYHEDALIRLDTVHNSAYSRERRDDYRDYARNRDLSAKTNLVGSSSNLPSPKFPKDDSNVTKKGKTPEEKGARGCIHCGSRKHWDRECKYAFKGDKFARTNLSRITSEEQEAQEEYDNLYYESDSEHEEEPERELRTYHVAHQPETSKAGAGSLKLPLNRRSRRRLAKTIEDHEPGKRDDAGDLLELQRHMARPPGCSFLGSKAIETEGYVGGLSEQPMRIIMDSGSDITLISEAALQALNVKPRIKQGQKINLIQVTGNCSISGYVELDIYFQTNGGPVKLTTEAYVVKGMSTPFIFGNDFADQYSISILREEGRTRIQFGETSRSILVRNSVGSSLTNEEGHVFKIRANEEFLSSRFRNRRHKRELKRRTRARKRQGNNEIRAAERTVIPPETNKRILIRSNVSSVKAKSLFLERQFIGNPSGELCAGIPDTLITVNTSFLQMANFSDKPYIVTKGQLLGIGRNADTWLDKAHRYDKEDRKRIDAHARLIKELVQTRENNTIFSQTEVSSKAQRNATEPDDPASEEPIEGGPKTSEVPPEDIPASKLLSEVDISPALTTNQREALEKVIMGNEMAFGLDGRLGNYEAKVEIRMKEGVTPISLPPFPASPAKREIIDKQMDAWISLGVIEPSKSPWAAPVFIVYRNGKPRMVIDLRKFNENVVPDEFPLPRQDDILQALTGAQWLSTLDALAGFTQLTLTNSASEKLAFRTHRGLWQFKRMPFGYRNGPSVFQRVMQNVLAPFLWIFALVYIDDIVIFSQSFDDHLTHLDKIFKAISSANITLSPPKCHFAYQSLVLLGQKVSRLGLSTHKEKVDAILALERPRNVSELQTFLGMMVYFASYIPFYAWIAHPLFQLVRKEKPWNWEALHEEAFELCKQVLSNAPIRGYAKPGLPYRVYTDACDYGLAGILQQVQPISVKDLRGTKAYERLQRAFTAKEPIPSLVSNIHKDVKDVPTSGEWGRTLDSTVVYVERVIAYWSRVLKSAERNYSPTEREALALKEALIKFQPFLEGEDVLAITDHAALTWSRTFQNVNRRLLTWGTVFSAYPKLKIVHRAGRVHSNVDPISRLRRRVPMTLNPVTDDNAVIELATEDPMANMFDALAHKFEERLLKIATKTTNSDTADKEDLTDVTVTQEVDARGEDGEIHRLDIPTSESYSILIGITEDELKEWKDGYYEDNHFAEVLTALRAGSNKFSQYHYSDNGLIYFEDAIGRDRLCVPSKLRTALLEEVHETVSEAAHAGYHKTYNRLASTYYWPRMSRDVKIFVTSCDICQKIKPRRELAAGLLQPIPIPSQPFEVVSMDFIPELPNSQGYDNILVIVDKLTKYGIFIPCTTSVTEEETAALFFKYVIAHYGIPRQVITDRDSRWRNEFWGETCRLMGIKRALTTSYHPQADGQTEILNQTLEIALRAYIDKTKSWAEHLDGIMLAYNSTPHSATTFSPAYLLRGYTPIVRSTILHTGESIDRNISANSTEQRAVEILEKFEADRQHAMDALKLGQAHQQLAYNKEHRDLEFEEGGLVLINPHSLELLRKEKGRGVKLLLKYDGPFEILQKLSPVSYRLRLPVSYGIHPVINISHLVSYTSSPPELGERSTMESMRQSFKDLPEEEIEKIIDERLLKTRGNGRRRKEYKVRFLGYDESHDEWLTKRELSNAPEILNDWIDRNKARLRVTIPRQTGVQKDVEELKVRRSSRTKA